MNAYCKRFDKCYFPKDIAEQKEYIGRTEVNKYICSCNFGGLDCELEKMDDITFKIFERINKK